MKKTNVQVLAFALAMAVVLTLSVSAHAQSADLFKSKCAMCHGADGTGSAMGKKMGAHDFTSADVQKMSDTDLTGVIANGKEKMPKYADKLKPAIHDQLRRVNAIKVELTRICRLASAERDARPGVCARALPELRADEPRRPESAAPRLPLPCARLARAARGPSRAGLRAPPPRQHPPST